MQERVQVADVAQVYELWNEFAAAASDGDLDRWIDLWTDDGIQIPQSGPYRVGKSEIRRRTRAMFDAYHTTKMIIQPEEVRILGNRAYTHGTYEVEMVRKAGGTTKRRAGKFLGILEKHADGSWKISVDCHNSATP
jgi:uncharacterized protein (TIGR02246 family)